jgi:hypothetical protein
MEWHFLAKGILPCAASTKDCKSFQVYVVKENAPDAHVECKNFHLNKSTKLLFSDRFHSTSQAPDQVDGRSVSAF